MLKNIIYSEIKNILYSPKFTVIFFIISIVMILSVYLGIVNYEYSLNQYNTVNQLVREEMNEKSDWMSLSNKIHRKPDQMQIFISGISNDIGRFSSINSIEGIKLTHSFYSNSPVYALFRFIDFGFIVTIILTLFVILFTYDAINGEVERGTLRLVFSNAVPRKLYILGKAIGIWLGLIIPLLIPILLSILLIIIWDIPFTNEHWLRLLILILQTLLLYTFFIVFGIFISTLTRKSSVSFLLSLVIWICLVFIIPRVGIMLAGQIINVPGEEEIQGKKSAYEKQAWEKYMNNSSARWKTRNMGIMDLTDEERRKYNDEHMWEWMSEEDEERKLVQSDIEKHNSLLNEQVKNAKLEQEKLAYTLSRISPVSAFQFSAMVIGGSDISVKTQYETAMNQYRQSFMSYKEEKQKKSGSLGGIRIMVDSDGRFDLQTGRDQALDISDMPKFNHPDFQLGKVISTILIDAIIIIFLTSVLFVITFFQFLRYDVR